MLVKARPRRTLENVLYPWFVSLSLGELSWYNMAESA